jgi:hypothetical protein
MARYEWLMIGLRTSLLAALGVGCDAEVADTPPDGGTPDARPPDAAAPAACTKPTPVLNAAGEASGWVRCEDGALNRLAAGTCDQPPPGTACTESGVGECAADSDCGTHPRGRCIRTSTAELTEQCGCVYPCETDADCAVDQLCLCDAAEGARCVHADCRSNQDCDSGECGLSASEYSGCGIGLSVACRTVEDACHGLDDCIGPCIQGDGSIGEPAGPGWVCQGEGACGRPLIIDGALRLAAPEGRCDWSEGLQPLAPSPAEAAALATFWSNIAALEHASVASFSKFSLQLMALGAPADLLMATQRAAADEVVHAQLAYGLASAYAQHPIGPGPLALGDLNIETDPAAIVAALVEEACVGETLGAADAAAAAADCTDPVVATVWRRIAEDELRHAQLGWRTLQWMLAKHPETRAVAAAAFTHAHDHWMARARAARPGAAMPTVLGALDRAQVHREALLKVITPCALQLVA